MECVLGKIQKLVVSSEVAERICHGQRIKDKNLVNGLKAGAPVAVWYKEKVVAIMHVHGDVLHPDCILI